MGSPRHTPHHRLITMRTTLLFSLFLSSCSLSSLCCGVFTEKQSPTPSHVPRVVAEVETSPVPASATDDAADDPAIWVHPTDPKKSMIIGTVKRYGLEVYSLKGVLLHTYRIGNPNNVDVRYGFTLGNGQTIDVAACSDRSNNQVALFHIEPSTRALLEIARIQSNLTEVYGICLYRSAVSERFYVFVNGKDGSMEQYELSPEGQTGISGKLKRTFRVETQPEGLVADDNLGVVYLGEEDKAIWKLQAEPDKPATLSMLTESLPAKNRPIKYDIEGLAIFPTGDTTGYLIASSQGNNTYAVFERSGNNRYLGSFAIGDNTLNGVDGTAETDGLDVTAQNLGSPFENGMLVVQDGFNLDGQGKSTSQNFKLVSWKNILPLINSWKK